MKRFFILLLCCLLCLPSALAEPCFKFASSVYAGICGREVLVQYMRLRTSESGQILLAGEDGSILASEEIPAGKNGGVFTVSLDESMPAGQTLRLLFRQGENTECQDEALLAMDRLYQDGVRKVDTEEKKIALTFDTSVGIGDIYGLLELLDRYQIRCTFFLEGKFAKYHPEETAKIDACSHEIGNHSMTHPEMREIDNDEILREINLCTKYITAVTGKPVTLYRPPAGYYSYRDRAISRALGYEMVLWTFDSGDGFSDREIYQISGYMKNHTEPGAIILMHIYGKYTRSVLRDYIPSMLEKGYTFCTVTELLKDYAPPQPEAEQNP